MKIDAIVAEIGSTTTVINAFDNLENNPIFLGQGFSKTTVLEGDVNIGLKQALLDLQSKLQTNKLEYQESFACSSAAGGLKMSVHGLVYDMTVKAAREAALGAGANLHLITAGKLSPIDIQQIKSKNLNIIMIAGGVDYGEKETALENALKIAELRLNIPVLYSGNVVNQEQIRNIFKENNQSDYLYITDNVYPKIDTLNVEAIRVVIQQIFEDHITKAPGMEQVRKTISENIIPTPGAVLEASIILQHEIGDLVTVDIGGATTDVHSVTNGSPELERFLISPEPFAKRTVEGDLGVYINKDNIINIIGKDNLLKELGLNEDSFLELVRTYQPIPTPKQIPLVEQLTSTALNQAIKRHAGNFVNIYGINGKTKIAEGKDLTNVNAIIATGGALTRLPHRKQIIEVMLNNNDPMLLKPKPNTKILIDQQYIMATLGVLSKKYPQAALKLLKTSLGIR